MAYGKWKIKKISCGFSLIETIITIFIFTIIMGALSFFIYRTYRAYSYNLQQVAAINEARRGIEIMVKEIREARYGEDGAFPISQAGDYYFIFYGDIDRDSQVERIRYFIDGTSFKKGVVEPTGDPPQYVLTGETVATISSFVQNGATTPVFKYYNGDWPGDIINNPLPTLTRLTDTKLMYVYLMVNVDPLRPPDNFILESDTQIRNLKTNL